MQALEHVVLVLSEQLHEHRRVEPLPLERAGGEQGPFVVREAVHAGLHELEERVRRPGRRDRAAEMPVAGAAVDRAVEGVAAVPNTGTISMSGGAISRTSSSTLRARVRRRSAEASACTSSRNGARGLFAPPIGAA